MTERRHPVTIRTVDLVPDAEPHVAGASTYTAEVPGVITRVLRPVVEASSAMNGAELSYTYQHRLIVAVEASASRWSRLRVAHVALGNTAEVGGWEHWGEIWSGYPDAALRIVFGLYLSIPPPVA